MLSRVREKIGAKEKVMVSSSTSLRIRESYRRKIRGGKKTLWFSFLKLNQ